MNILVLLSRICDASGWPIPFSLLPITLPNHNSSLVCDPAFSHLPPIGCVKNFSILGSMLLSSLLAAGSWNSEQKNRARRVPNDNFQNFDSARRCALP